MTGKVLVDDVDTADGPSRSSTPRWLGVIGAAVVVGALAMLTGEPEPPEPTVTIPEVELAEDRWTPLILPGAGALTDVTQLAGGNLVAVGEGPQIWVSVDRQRWAWAIGVDVPPGALMDAAPFGEGAVTVGSDHLDDGDTKAAIWHSEDGSHWQRAAVRAAIPSGLEGVTVGGGRAVAWGWEGSQNDFAFDGESMLRVSEDGRDWDPVEVPSNLHIDTVEWVAPHWYFGGYVVGRPALWRAATLGEWERVATDEMIFGWSVVNVENDDGLVATLSDLSGYAGMREWRQTADGTWDPVDIQPELPLTARGDGTAAAGEGNLWQRDEGQWRQLQVAGEIFATAGQVAVGTNGDRPLILVQDAAEVEASVAQAGDGAWEVVEELRSGSLLGVWPAADGWVIGTEGGWWFHGGSPGTADDSRTRRFNPPWVDAPTDIRQVGDEWVALPGMQWTVDGTDWDRRTQPWFAGVGVPGRVEAVTALGDQILAVGFNRDHLWTLSASPDGGRNWEILDEPRAATPLWDVVGTGEGFIATAAREQGRREAVSSRDGLAWEALGSGAVVVAGSPTPAAVTADGELWLLGTQRRIPAPRRDIDLVLSREDRVAVRTQGAVWVHDGKWERIPLDAPHGLLGPAHPMLMEEGLQAVVSDGESTVIQEWHN